MKANPIRTQEVQKRVAYELCTELKSVLGIYEFKGEKTYCVEKKHDGNWIDIEITPSRDRDEFFFGAVGDILEIVNKYAGEYTMSILASIEATKKEVHVNGKDVRKMLPLVRVSVVMPYEKGF